MVLDSRKLTVCQEYIKLRQTVLKVLFSLFYCIEVQYTLLTLLSVTRIITSGDHLKQKEDCLLILFEENSEILLIHNINSDVY